MEQQKRVLFGTMPDETAVEAVTLEKGKLSCRILTYGGAVQSLVVPDRDGNPVDVVLGFDTLEDYRKQDKYIGALIGRYGNRIGGASFSLNGTAERTTSTAAPVALTSRCGRWRSRRRTASPCPFRAPTARRATPETCPSR